MKYLAKYIYVKCYEFKIYTQDTNKKKLFVYIFYKSYILSSFRNPSIRKVIFYRSLVRE